MDTSTVSPDLPAATPSASTAPSSSSSSSSATSSAAAAREEIAPQYDSSEEWEIGLGNLIIDLDADLEKDRQDVAVADASSPMRIGKMKIKRKVSSTKGEGTASSPRKDPPSSSSSNSSSSSSSSSSAGDDTPAAAGTTGRHNSPERQEPVAVKPRVVIHHKKDSSGKQERVYSTSGQASTAASASKVTGGLPLPAGLLNSQTNPTVALVASAASASSPPQVPSQPPSGTGKSTASDGTNHILASHAVTIGLSPVKVTIGTAKDSDKRLSKADSREDEARGREDGKKDDREVKGDTSSNKKDGSHGSTTKKHSGKKAKNEKVSSHSVAVDTSDMSTLTDPDCLGPCEPGTSVNLEGIVWHETDQGVLVVNVTWRNKTYVGTLLDCTKHDWAPPRFCDSPTSDMENRNAKTPGRPKRGRNSSSAASSSDLSNFTETRSSIHSKLRNSTTIKGRRGSGASNGSRTPPNAAAPAVIERAPGKRKARPTDIDLSSGEDSGNKGAKRLKAARTPTPNSSEGGATSPVFIECPEPNCNKKYKHINGLRYHQTHAHQDLPRQEPAATTPDEPEHSESAKAAADETSADSGKASKGDKTPEDSEVSPSTSSPTKVSGNSTEKAKDSKAAPASTTAEKQEESISPCLAAAGASTEVCKDPSTAKETTKARADVSRSPKGGQHKAGPQDHKASPSKLLHGTNKAKDATVAAASASAAKSKVDSSHASDKASGKHKKPASNHQSPASVGGGIGGVSNASVGNQKDMSVFDFNSTAEIEDHSKKASTTAAEKQTGVSVIRSNPEQIVVKTEPLSPPPMNIPKTPDTPKMTLPPGSEEVAQRHVAKGKEKDRAKGQTAADKKKPKPDKAMPKSKSARPIAPAPPHPQPPQLIAIPTIVTTSSGPSPAPLTIPAVTTKPAAGPAVPGPALKPIQPKPTVPDNPALNASLATLKEKKPKPKKKSKTDREKHAPAVCPTKEGPHKADPKDSKLREGKPKDGLPAIVRPEQLQESSVAAALENNILKQALTASGIGPEDAGRNSPYVAGASAEGQPKGGESSAKDTPKDLPSLIPGRPPVSAGMPEMPKLIPTSSLMNSANRPPHHAAAPMQPQKQPPPPPPTKPIIPSSPEAVKAEYQGLPPSQQPQPQPQPQAQPQPQPQSQPQPQPQPQPQSQSQPQPQPQPQQQAQQPQGKPNSLPSDLPVPTLTVPPNTEDGRAGSPAYSDISDANDDPPLNQAKPREERDPYAFHDPPSARPSQGSKHIPEDLRRVERVEPMAGPMFSPLTEVARERGISNESLAKSMEPARSTPSQPPVKPDSGKDEPEAKKARKDTPSPSTEMAYRPQAPPGAIYGGQYPLLPSYVEMDPSYHQRLISTDPHYRQQHEHFVHEQRKRAEAERAEREKHEQESGKEKPTSEGAEAQDRPIPKIKTEPVTPTKRDSVAEAGKAMRTDKDLKRKSERDFPPESVRAKQLDFHKGLGAEGPDALAFPGPPKMAAEAAAGRSLQEQQREEMRLYSLIDHKQRELQRQEEEQRKAKQEDRRRAESADGRRDSRRLPDDRHHEHDHARRGSVSPRRDTPKDQPSSTPSSKPLAAGEEKKHRESPLPSKSQSPQDKGPPRGLIPPSRRVLDTYPAYLQPPYVQLPFGPVPFDPNHPAYQAVNPMVAYPAYLPHELHYPPPPPGSRVISPMWKSQEERGRYEVDRERSGTSSPHSSGSKSRDSSRERPPTKALDVLQQHANQYFSSHKGERSMSPEPERERRQAPSPGPPASPAERKTPVTPTSRADSPRYDASRRHGPPVPAHLLHQHMHTHQHTHLGMGYPVLQPYDPYVLASHQQAAAAAAAAASSVNPYAVRRE